MSGFCKSGHVRALSCMLMLTVCHACQCKEDTAATAMFKISFIEELPITATNIAFETNKDFVLSQEYQFVLEGWHKEELMTS